MNNWHIVWTLDGQYVNKSKPLCEETADHMCQLSQLLGKAYVFKVVHRDDLTNEMRG